MGESVAAGSLVELGDEFAGGGEHDRVQPCGAVVLPGGEHLFGDGGEVADVDPLVVEIEPDRLSPAVAQGEGGGGFGRVAEPQRLGEPDRPVGGLDVAEHPAGTDRGELLVIADQPDTAAPLDDVANGGVE